jgi:hyaluronate lyase
MCVNAVSSEAWSETGITWSNQPAAGSTLDCEDIGSTGWVAFDVTNFVAREVVSDRIVTLRISDTASSNRMVRFESREGANAPSLVVR